MTVLVAVIQEYLGIAVDPFAGLLIAGEVGRWGGVAGGRRFSPFSPFSI